MKMKLKIKKKMLTNKKEEKTWKETFLELDLFKWIYEKYENFIDREREQPVFDVYYS
jgi:hypothetical protein